MLGSCGLEYFATLYLINDFIHIKIFYSSIYIFL